MAYLLLLLIALTAAFWLLHRLKIFTVCPICSATVLTWIIGIIFLYVGSSWINSLFIALLMGASLGALAEKLGGKLGFIWKTLAVLLGSSGVYFLLNEEPLKAVPLVAALLAVTLFKVFNPTEGSRTRVLRDRFKGCC